MFVARIDINSAQFFRDFEKLTYYTGLAMLLQCYRNVIADVIANVIADDFRVVFLHRR